MGPFGAKGACDDMGGMSAPPKATGAAPLGAGAAPNAGAGVMPVNTGGGLMFCGARAATGAVNAMLTTSPLDLMPLMAAIISFLRRSASAAELPEVPGRLQTCMGATSCTIVVPDAAGM